ncbi:hypothetical protein OC844_005307 [Tilletia horrida]|nr:hypothetical protein OC844_005307 [Tilletia horrida]
MSHRIESEEAYNGEDGLSSDDDASWDDQPVLTQTVLSAAKELRRELRRAADKGTFRDRSRPSAFYAPASTGLSNPLAAPAPARASPSFSFFPESTDSLNAHGALMPFQPSQAPRRTEDPDADLAPPPPQWSSTSQRRTGVGSSGKISSRVNPAREDQHSADEVAPVVDLGVPAPDAPDHERLDSRPSIGEDSAQATAPWSSRAYQASTVEDSARATVRRFGNVSTLIQPGAGSSSRSVSGAPTYGAPSTSLHQSPGQMRITAVERRISELTGAATLASLAQQEGGSGEMNLVPSPSPQSPWALRNELRGTRAQNYCGPLSAAEVIHLLTTPISAHGLQALTAQCRAGYLKYWHFLGGTEVPENRRRGKNPSSSGTTHTTVGSEEWLCRCCHTALRVPVGKVSNLGVHLYGSRRKPIGCLEERASSPAEPIPAPLRDTNGRLIRLMASKDLAASKAPK